MTITLEQQKGEIGQYDKLVVRLIIGSAELSGEIGVDVIWGRSNKWVDIYPIRGPGWPILGVSLTLFVRPTSIYAWTYLNITLSTTLIFEDPQ